MEKTTPKTTRKKLVTSWCHYRTGILPNSISFWSLLWGLLVNLSGFMGVWWFDADITWSYMMYYKLEGFDDHENPRTATIFSATRISWNDVKRVFQHCSRGLLHRMPPSFCGHWSLHIPRPTSDLLMFGMWITEEFVVFWFTTCQVSWLELPSKSLGRAHLTGCIRLGLAMVKSIYISLFIKC